MDSAGWQSVWLAVAALIFSAATLWSGSRKVTVDLLRTRVDTLERENDDLRRQLTAAKNELDTLRSMNMILQREALNRPPGARRPRQQLSDEQNND